ncbi:hypothetical protein C4D60_Mb08t01430 [Musa balbisiana]|uniref:Uncharacterized protein n=1 Tax=Musa balbisiana TaxID=52838 RepID=A0A4S8K0M6_MUSBA|nr:hypothetical protein C4D60_Mb08t01430 [Musa balbisiana]
MAAMTATATMALVMAIFVEGYGWEGRQQRRELNRAQEKREGSEKTLVAVGSHRPCGCHGRVYGELP